jgi:hypothetical protein
MKKVLALVAVSTLLASTAMADEAVVSKFKLSVGGYIKLDYAYNSDNLGTAGTITPGGGGLGAALATKTGASQQEQSILGMKQSRLWLKVDGPTLYGAKTGGLVEVDFYGDNSTPQESPQPRMRLAYATIDWDTTSILFGQYWDMFAPMVANTQDFRCGSTTGAPNNPRSPQIKLTQRINFTKDEQLQLVFGLTDPTQYGDNSGGAIPQTTGNNSYGPNLAYAGQVFFTSNALGVSPGYFGMSNKPLTLGFFGQWSNEKLQAYNTKAVDSWGYGAYFFAPILKSAYKKGRAMTLSLEGQVYEAANMAYDAATAAQFANGATAGGTYANGVVAPSNGLAQQPRKDMGIAAQLIFYPTQDLGLTAGYGVRMNANKASDMLTAAGANVIYQKFNQEIYFNAAYDFNAAVRVAAEYQFMSADFANMTQASSAVVAPGRTALATVNIGRLCPYYFF